MGELLIRNGLVVTPQGIFQWDIRVSNGIISEVGRGLWARSADRVIDARGLYVFPGVVDEHVHMREPGLVHKDDFEHGTRAAIKGGVTTVIEHPNTVPPVDSANRLISKGELLSGKAHADFALLGVLHDNNIGEFENMLRAGAVGFKVFMGPTTGNISPPSDASLYEVLRKSAINNVRIMFHAEDHALVTYFTEKVKGSGRNDPAAHEEARPPIAEYYSILKIAAIARDTGGRAHIVHISSKEALEAVELARLYMGADVTSETCPHYLLFDKGDYGKYEALIKVNPPIRGGSHRKALLEAISRRLIDAIGSDHAPHSPEEKLRPIWEAASGFAGVQTLFPLVLDMALSGLIPITRVPYLLSESPAKLFGLWPEKGSLMPGASGDLVIVDPSAEFVVTEEWLEYKYKLSPYVGWRLRGATKYVVLRGEVVVEEGEVLGVKAGRWIRRAS